MGILSGLFKSRDTPKNTTVGAQYAFYLGGSAAGKIVTERSAMQMTAVHACVRILSEAIAGLPLHVYRYRDGVAGLFHLLGRRVLQEGERGLEYG